MNEIVLAGDRVKGGGGGETNLPRTKLCWVPRSPRMKIWVAGVGLQTNTCNTEQGSNRLSCAICEADFRAI